MTEIEGDAVPAPVRQGPLYRIVRGFLRPLVRLVYRPKITGAEHVPMRGPVILASNHLSFVDSIVIPLASPRPVQFLPNRSPAPGRPPPGAHRQRMCERVFERISVTVASQDALVHL